jgi:hypothetical protein
MKERCAPDEAAAKMLLLGALKLVPAGAELARPRRRAA